MLVWTSGALKSLALSVVVALRKRRDSGCRVAAGSLGVWARVKTGTNMWMLCDPNFRQLKLLPTHKYLPLQGKKCHLRRPKKSQKSSESNETIGTSRLDLGMDNPPKIGRLSVFWTCSFYHMLSQNYIYIIISIISQYEVQCYLYYTNPLLINPNLLTKERSKVRVILSQWGGLYVWCSSQSIFIRFHVPVKLIFGHSSLCFLFFFPQDFSSLASGAGSHGWERNGASMRWPLSRGRWRDRVEGRSSNRFSALGVKKGRLPSQLWCETAETAIGCWMLVDKLIGCWIESGKIFQEAWIPTGALVSSNWEIVGLCSVHKRLQHAELCSWHSGFTVFFFFFYVRHLVALKPLMWYHVGTKPDYILVWISWLFPVVSMFFLISFFCSPVLEETHKLTSGIMAEADVAVATWKVLRKQNGRYRSRWEQKLKYDLIML